MLNKIIYLQNKFRLDVVNKDYPELRKEYKRLESDKRLESNAFQLPLFSDKDKTNESLKILGVIKNKRVYRYINKNILI